MPLPNAHAPRSPGVLWKLHPEEVTAWEQPSTSTELKPGCIKTPHTFISRTLQQPLTLVWLDQHPFEKADRRGTSFSVWRLPFCPLPVPRAALPASWRPGGGSLQVLAPPTALQAMAATRKPARDTGVLLELVLWGKHSSLGCYHKGLAGLGKDMGCCLILWTSLYARHSVSGGKMAILRRAS